MEVVGMFYEWFWDESFWLPGNVSWKSLERNDEEYYPQVSDLKIVFPLAGFLYFVRCVWERSVALHIGRYYNIKEQTPRKIPYNEVLEQAFRKHGKTFPLPDIAKVLAQEANMTYGQAERWWRKRAIHSKPAKMQRFTETCWRFLYYFLSFWSGLFVLWNKPWLWDTKECWNGFPKQHVSMDIRIYYMIQLSFYVSLIFSLFKDVRRKDFQQMIVHHFATVLLMVMSWCNNMVRVGSLVLCLHDTVDYWLEGAKLANYLHYNKVCDVLFLIFALLWFVSRLVIYPLRILNSTWFECHELLGDFTSHYIFNILLSLLFILHIIWFCTIMKMVLKFMVKGKVEKDGRSDTESSSSSEEATKTEDGNYYYGTEDHNVRLRASLKNLESEFGKNKNGVVS